MEYGHPNGGSLPIMPQYTTPLLIIVALKSKLSLTKKSYLIAVSYITIIIFISLFL